MKEIKLSQGKVAKVDDEDYEYLNQWKWCVMKSGNVYYAHRKFTVSKNKRETVQMHRLLMNPDNNKTYIIDHRDRDGLNNQKYNLRKCTHAENIRNRVNLYTNKTSKYKGVSWEKGCKKFRAKITYNGVIQHLGVFKTDIEAAKAYDKAAVMYFGEFSKLNFDNNQEIYTL